MRHCWRICVEITTQWTTKVCHGQGRKRVPAINNVSASDNALSISLGPSLESSSALNDLALQRPSFTPVMLMKRKILCLPPLLSMVI